MSSRALEVLVTDNRVAIIGSVRDETDRNILRDQCKLVLTNRPAELVLDLTQAKYLDVTALTTLLSIARRAADIGCRIRLEGANDDLVMQLRVTKIDLVLKTIDDRAKRKGMDA